jgi:hypothetical protein
MMQYLGNFARTGDPNDGSGASAGGPLPHWEPHSPQSAEVMALGGEPAMATLPAETTERYKLLAARYFSELVPRQLKEGAPPPPQRQPRRRGGWNGRRRQRL